MVRILVNVTRMMAFMESEQVKYEFIFCDLPFDINNVNKSNKIGLIIEN